MGLTAGKGAAQPGVVAHAGAFDLDDFSAHVGHELGGIWGRGHLADFEDLETC